MAKKLVLSILYVLIVVLVTARFGQSKFITQTASSLELVSDGIDNVRKPSVIELKGMFSTEDSCEQTYGFLPCTSTIVGNLFLMIVYGFLMYQAAKLLSNGSELLLEILHPGIIGGLILPILKVFPDSMLMLVSGLSGSRETAQTQIQVGIGLTAGSTIMFLTFLWGSCVIAGKCDIDEHSMAKDLKDTKGLSLTGSGVCTEIWTCHTARIMSISFIPFIILQAPEIFHLNSGRHFAVLIALIFSVALLLTYCLYQVFQPWIQRRSLEYVRYKHVMSGVLKYLKIRAMGKLLTDDGQPNTEVINKLFKAIDLDSDGQLSHSELRALLIGISFDEIDLDKNDAADKLIKDFDTSQNQYVDEEEFRNGISRWINEAKRSVVLDGNLGHHTMKVVDEFHRQTKKEHYLLGDICDEAVENSQWISIKAVLMLLLGTVIAAAIADPLVDAVDNFSTATGIPCFFVSFVALPLATKSSEALSILISARQKKRRNVSLAFFEDSPNAKQYLASN